MEAITYKKQTSKIKYITEAAVGYRPPLNISRNFFSEKKKPRLLFKKIRYTAPESESEISVFFLINVLT